jgi:long-chain acyl-CoA synthetase
MFPGAHVFQNPDKPAVIMGTTGEMMTFAELDAAANRLSQLFYSAGLRPGDHVAFCLENHFRYLEVAWGCHYAGLIYTACSSRLTSAELTYIIADCRAKAFITSHHKAAQAEEISGDMPGVSVRLMLDGTIDGYESYEAAVDARPATPLVRRIAGTDMLYSSGTTGRPKGVMRAFVEEPLIDAAGSVTPLLSLLFGFTSASSYLSPAPLYHAAPLRFCMSAQALGGTVVVMEQFDPEQYLQLLERHRTTHSQLVPTMFVRMLKLPAEVRARYDVSSLQCAIHAAAPCPIPVKKQMIEWWGPVIHEYYAGTEGNGFVYCNSEMWLAHAGTVGTPINCKVHICDDEGHDVAHFEPGTIWFEGGASFEYHNDPDKTRGSRHPNGWSTLGDVGYLDDDNFLYLTDRKAYMIISGGVNIYPQEAENVLASHPAVADVAVIGVPDAEMGEAVKAVVEPTDPVSAGPELEAQLLADCRSQLAGYKCPRSVDFVDSLPRDPNGKLYKRVLRERYWEGHDSLVS